MYVPAPPFIIKFEKHKYDKITHRQEIDTALRIFFARGGKVEKVRDSALGFGYDYDDFHVVQEEENE